MQVFNTMSLEKEAFTPINGNKVNMYVCGPTVYNYIHIGNARSAIAFDTIRRYLTYRGYEVNYVSNFTDVDDKMITAAKAEGITVEALAERYIAAYFEDTAPLNVQPATTQPRATEHIPEIIDFVSDLIAQGAAYEVEGDVYFRAKQFPDYGHLAHQDLAEMEENAAGRLDPVEVARKEDPMDFALWKQAPDDGTIAWASPWGHGRPGWHIECSVMATKYLGNHFDIHGGGIDLAFPHHTNEIAQSESRTHETFANKWLHNGFVTVGDDATKMSKSLGNFTTVHALLKELDDPMILRLMMAATHYRRPITYSQSNLDQAARYLERIRTAYRNLAFRQSDAVAGRNAEIDVAGEALVAQFVTAMDDDFNTQNGMTAIHALVDLMNQYATATTVHAETATELLAALSDLMGIMGVLDLGDKLSLDADIQALIDERDQARANKDFARSDAIRDQLQAQSIVLEDTPQGTRWHRA